jgi:serine/threonine-protein kinase
MNIRRLTEVLPSELAPEVTGRWEKFQRGRKRATPTSFLALLHEEGVINGSQLGDALGALEVQVTFSQGLQGQEMPIPEGPRYRLVGLLGKGAMGEVHIAREPSLNRNVAVKRMDPAVARDPDLSARFLTEAQITAQLDHPGIVPVYAFEVRGDGTREYAMKMIRGRTLEEVIEETRAALDARRKLDEHHSLRTRLDLFLQVCNAMAYAHDRGVIHRDLKPENVMVGAFHEVIVMDWGIGKVIGTPELIPASAVEEGKATETQVGIIIGTPQYMSPEQAEGLNDELEGRSDLYSLGLILYELVCLKPARVGGTPYEMIFAAQKGVLEPVRPYTSLAPVPRELRAIIGRATILDRERRYSDVAALADDIRRFLADREVLASRDTVLQRAQRWISHHRELTLAGILGLVLLLVLVAVVSVGGGLAALEVDRRAAARREAAIGAYVAEVSSQASHMDTQFRRFEGLVEGLAFSAEHALTHDPPRVAYYLQDGFDDPDRQPPDLLASDIYVDPISFGFPDTTLAPGVNESAARRRILQLNALTPRLRDVLLRGRGAELLELSSEQQARMLVAGRIPVVWAYVATEDGLMVGIPGQGLYEDDYDPREMEWYQWAREQRTPAWSTAGVDESDWGLLMTCARALFDDEQRLLGVAALDLTYKYVVSELMEPEGLPVEVDTWLVNSEGLVEVDSRLKEEARHVVEFEWVPYPHQEILEATRSESGAQILETEIDGERRLFAWSRVESLDMTYIVSGSAEEVLSR